MNLQPASISSLVALWPLDCPSHEGWIRAPGQCLECLWQVTS